MHLAVPDSLLFFFFFMIFQTHFLSLTGPLANPVPSVCFVVDTSRHILYYLTYITWWWWWWWWCKLECVLFASPGHHLILFHHICFLFLWLLLIAHVWLICCSVCVCVCSWSLRAFSTHSPSRRNRKWSLSLYASLFHSFWCFDSTIPVCDPLSLFLDIFFFFFFFFHLLPSAMISMSSRLPSVRSSFVSTLFPFD